jgi:hypothetical protein
MIFRVWEVELQFPIRRVRAATSPTVLYGGLLEIRNHATLNKRGKIEENENLGEGG